MKVFASDPIEIPAVQLTQLKDDEEGRELLDRLEALRQRKTEAEAELREVGRPLSDLVARADELAARALVGDVDRDEADAAEADVWDLKQNIEQARRHVRQSERASELVREKLQARAEALHEENANAVRSVHRILLRQALEAERRAATLLRLLRDFEGRYARYASGDTPAHPEYLTEEERTSPPRALLGPARTPGGNVFNTSEAARWMQSAAQHLDEAPPDVIDLTDLDYEAEDATLTTYPLDEDDSPRYPDTDDSPSPESLANTPADDIPEDVDVTGDADAPEDADAQEEADADDPETEDAKTEPPNAPEEAEAEDEQDASPEASASESSTDEKTP